MVGSMTARNLTLNHLLGNIASLEHHNSNVRCIVNSEGSHDDASSIRWFIRWPSGAGAELTLLHERRRVRPALPHSWFDACNLSSLHLSLSNHSSVRHWDLGKRHGDIGGSFKTPSSDDLSGSSSWGYSWLLFSTGGSQSSHQALNKEFNFYGLKQRPSNYRNSRMCRMQITCMIWKTLSRCFLLYNNEEQKK